MNPDKRIRKAVDDCSKEILDRGKDFYEEIVRIQFENVDAVKKRKVNPRLSFILTIAVLFICIISGLAIGLPYLLRERGEEYFLQNEKSRIATLSELNEKLHSAQLNIKENTIANIFCFYDEKAMDDLYYKIEIEDFDTLEFVQMKIIVNEKYKNRDEVGDKGNKIQIKNFTANYYVNSNIDYEEYHELKATVKLGRVSMNIDYSAVCEENEFVTTFKDYMNSIII